MSKEYFNKVVQGILSGDVSDMDLRGYVITDLGIANGVYSARWERPPYGFAVHFDGCDLRGARICYLDLGHCTFNNVKAEGLETIMCISRYENRIAKGNGVRKYTYSDTARGINPYKEVYVAPKKVDGDIIGYKVIRIQPHIIFQLPPIATSYAIAKLRIPADAKRIIFDNDKCRAERAVVEDIRDFWRNDQIIFGRSIYDSTFNYVIGNEVVANGFEEDASIVCGKGLHFFLTEDEAREYLYDYISLP